MTTPIERRLGKRGLAKRTWWQHLSWMRMSVVVPLAAICCLIAGSAPGQAQDSARKGDPAGAQGMTTLGTGADVAGARTVAATVPASVVSETETPMRVTYAAYAAGLQIASVDAAFHLKPETYRVELALRTTGVVGWLVQLQTVTTVDGNWRADRPAPHQFFSQGEFRGEPRFSLIDYKQGQPLVRRLVPPNEIERELVPPEIQANSIDSLSAMAELMRVARRTGGCEGSTRVFDGRRASDVTARTVGQEIVPPSTRSVFNGPALRCDFVGKMVAGFWLDADRNAGQKPMKGSAWLADSLPGAPSGGARLPVRVTFESRWFGDVTLYLTGAAADQTPRQVVVR